MQAVTNDGLYYATVTVYSFNVSTPMQHMVHLTLVKITTYESHSKSAFNPTICHLRNGKKRCFEKK